MCLLGLLSVTLTPIWAPSCGKRRSCAACSLENIPERTHKCYWCSVNNRCYHFTSKRNPCGQASGVALTGLCYEQESPAYNSDNAFISVLLSAASYYSNPQMCIDAVLPGGSFQVVHKFQKTCDFNGTAAGECYVFTAVSHTHRLIVVIFRGVNSPDQLNNVITSVLKEDEVPFRPGGHVQKYFKIAHDVLEKRIRRVVSILSRKYHGYRFVFTGHSLGGTLATLASMTLVHQGIINKQNLTLYTFGMPRAGDGQFARAHDHLIGRSWRVVHHRDIVSHLPFCNFLFGCSNSSGPYHGKTEVFYYKRSMRVDSTRYKICPVNEDERCSNGLVSEQACLLDLDDCIHDHRYYFNVNVGSHCSQTVDKTRKTKYN